MIQGSWFDMPVKGAVAKEVAWVEAVRVVVVMEVEATVEAVTVGADKAAAAVAPMAAAARLAGWEGSLAVVEVRAAGRSSQLAGTLHNSPGTRWPPDRCRILHRPRRGHLSQ